MNEKIMLLKIVQIVFFSRGISFLFAMFLSLYSCIIRDNLGVKFTISSLLFFVF